MLKKDLTLQIMNQKGRYLKTDGYLKDDASEDKKAKGTKKCVIKRKRKFENHKNYLEGTKFENKINHFL